jgi:valine dehydrogenase (NAD+)
MFMTIAAARPSVAPHAALGDDDHEQIVVRQDPESGLRLIVAVHSTVLGPALGGMRVKRYPGGLREALEDVMGLAHTMTLKAAAAGLDLGGGKAVMIDDGNADLRHARLEAAAAVIDGLGGAYITAEDIGTTTADMDYMARFTRFCTGRSVEDGGGGDPSPVTAETVLGATRRGLAAQTGSADLDGRRVGVIGLGKVGGALAARLAASGARVVGCDLDAERCDRLAAEHGIEGR